MRFEFTTAHEHARLCTVVHNCARSCALVHVRALWCMIVHDGMRLSSVYSENEVVFR